MFRRLAATSVALCLFARSGLAAGLDISAASQRIDQANKDISKARDEIELVERAYTFPPEPSSEAELIKQWGRADLEYILQNYQGAAVILYDLVSNKDFQTNKLYPSALYELADSLYEQKNDLGARLYLRQLLLLGPSTPNYRPALARYLEIAGRLNEFSGIDEYVTQARNNGGGQLSPDLLYVYGKWLFRRQDIPVEERVARSRPTFEQLAASQGTFQLQAAYYLGVGSVRLKDYAKAIEQFRSIGKLPVKNAKDKKVVELASMSLARVLFETGKYDEAIDRYQEIQQSSENFPDALYETAWSYVRKGDLERAKNTTEVLLLVAEDSVLAPEARILQGTLLQKLQKYDEAIDTYNQVINQYSPVRDDIDALLSVHQDPVQYFDDLLARNEKSLDVTKLLPPLALKWASTREEVADAQAITTALDSSRSGISESRQLADQILKALDERGLETFPMLQEGFTRADAVETRVTHANEALTDVQRELLDATMGSAQRQQLDTLRAKAEGLKKRIDTLPKTREEVEARKARLQAEIDRLDKVAFQLGIEIQSLNAQVIGIRKYVDDTRTQRKDSKEDEKSFLDSVIVAAKELEAEQADVDALRANLVAQRDTAGSAVAGEDALRLEYQNVLREQQALLDTTKGAAASDVQQLLLKVNVQRADADAVSARVKTAKSVVRERVQQKMQKIREQVVTEQKLVESYAGETEVITGETRNLVGRIAFDSFKRVRQSFYDLVLKADVGVVDVSFQRKQDKTTQIQKLASQKDRELKQLDEEFKEVLKDVE